MRHHGSIASQSYWYKDDLHCKAMLSIQNTLQLTVAKQKGAALYVDSEKDQEVSVGVLDLTFL